MPSSKPFVSPEALAASTATATAHAVHKGGLGTLDEQVGTLLMYSPAVVQHYCCTALTMT